MITCFPIVQTSGEKKKKLSAIKRQLLCSSKLEFICNRLKKAKSNQIRIEIPNEDSTINYTSQSQQFDNKSPELISSIVHRYQSLQEVGQKKSTYRRNEGMHKSFNRTKTDWDHNFVGQKYMQKIKQELRSTKHTSFTQKQEIKYNPLQGLENCHEPFTIDPTCNLGKTHYRRGLSEEQLQRIKLLKQKRRKKIHESLKQFGGSKKIHQQPSLKRDISFEKSEPISPWDDYPSQFSSLYMKKN